MCGVGRAAARSTPIPPALRWTRTNAAPNSLSSKAARLSDPDVPGPAVPGLAELAQGFETVGDDDAVQELHALVTELPFHAQPQRRAVRDREIAAVHPGSQNRLRVQGVEHVDALGVVVERIEAHEASARAYAGCLQHRAQRHASPFGDRRPSFLAGVLGNLRARGEVLQLAERIAAGPRHAAFDPQTPVGELSTPQALVERSISFVVCPLVRVGR